MGKKIYVSSCCENGGIYVFDIENFEVKQTQFVPVDRPMYTIIESNKLYAVLRAPFDDNQNSGVVSFDIDKDGLLSNKSDVSSTYGQCGCHIYVSENDIYVTNYISGDIIKLPNKLIVHEDENHTKQPHTHYVGITPDKKFLVVTDLGLDKIFVYDKDLCLQKTTSLNEGAGPRHLVFSDDGNLCYCINELNSTVSVLEYSNGTLTLLESYSTLPDNYQGESFAAAIRVKNGYLYVSNRGHNSIACFEISGKSLKLKSITDCGGNFPRDINIYENMIFAANQKDGTFTIFKTENYFDLELIKTIKIDNALCITI